MVARRAHNPEVVRFKSHLRNQKENHPTGWFFFLLAAFGGWDLSLTAFGTKARPPPLSAECRANNLQPKRKGLSILFAMVDTTKQGEVKQGCALRAIRLCDWCGGRVVQILVPFPKHSRPTAQAELARGAPCFGYTLEKTVPRTVFSSLTPQPKTKAVHWTAFCFWNDVCPCGQVMLPSAVMFTT